MKDLVSLMWEMGIYNINESQRFPVKSLSIYIYGCWINQGVISRLVDCKYVAFVNLKLSCTL